MKINCPLHFGASNRIKLLEGHVFEGGIFHHHRGLDNSFEGSANLPDCGRNVALAHDVAFENLS